MRVSSKVIAPYKNVPVVEYLAVRFTYRPFMEWVELAENGRIFCNNTLCTPHTLVTQGDTITCELPDVAPPPVNLDYHIIYQDPWLLGINKPGNLHVHHKGKFVTANLMYHLREHHQPPYPEAQLVNRLDKNTSGVVLVARDAETARRMARLFEEQQVGKIYLAVVQGVPQPAEGQIVLPIGPVAGAKVPRYWVVGGEPGKWQVEGEGKTAVTQYRTLQQFTNYALVELQPKTGRTHQLRVHMAAMGHAVVGDALYTMEDDDFLRWCEEKPETAEMHGITRQALHCHQTSFIHPHTHLPCCITAPLPADIQLLLAQ